MYIRPNPPAALRKPTARFAQHWLTCLPQPEKFWIMEITQPGFFRPNPVLADGVDLSFRALHGETFGNLRLAVWKEAYEVIEETIEIEGVELRFYVGLAGFWFEWQRWRQEYPEVDSYTCEYDCCRG